MVGFRTGRAWDGYALCRNSLEIDRHASKVVSIAVDQAAC